MSPFWVSYVINYTIKKRFQFLLFYLKNNKIIKKLLKLKIDKRKLLLIIKLSIIVAHFLFSQGHVKHIYLNVLDSPSINSPSINSPSINSPSIKSSMLSNISVPCRVIINVPIFYPEFSGCFSNYAWVAILDDLNLLNNLISCYLNH